MTKIINLHKIKKIEEDLKNDDFQIVYNDDYIPSQLKTLIKENKDEYKILLRDFDGNYAQPFGLPDKWSLTENVFKEIYQ